MCNVKFLKFFQSQKKNIYFGGWLYSLLHYWDLAPPHKKGFIYCISLSPAILTGKCLPVTWGSGFDLEKYFCSIIF